MSTQPAIRTTRRPAPGRVVLLPPPGRPEALPRSYGETRLVLLEVEPRRVHAWWDVSDRDLARPGRTVLRFHDVFQVLFDGTNANSSFEVEVGDADRSWYVETPAPGRAYVADLVRRSGDGRDVLLARSGAVQMLREGESAPGRTEWTRAGGERSAGVFVDPPDDLMRSIGRLEVVAFYERLVAGTDAR